MNRILAFVVGAVVLAVLVRASTFVVDQRQNAIVFQLGQIKRVITEPGLYFRIPLVQNVEYQDRRILTIDTPGGLSTSMDDIVKDILGARKTPVIGYVSPDGARAASAGAYIMLSTDVAAMAPSTGGQSIPSTVAAGRDHTRSARGAAVDAPTPSSTPASARNVSSS